jgi:hypothetical protein
MISSAIVSVSDEDSKYLQEDPSPISLESHPSAMTYSKMAPSSNFTDFIHLDLEKLALESPPDDHFPANACLQPLPVSRDVYSLDGPFTPVDTKPSTVFDNEGTIIDTFAPRPSPFNLSPTSSIDSDLDGALGTSAFFATRSRVVRVSFWHAYSVMHSHRLATAAEFAIPSCFFSEGVVLSQCILSLSWRQMLLMITFRRP